MFKKWNKSRNLFYEIFGNISLDNETKKKFHVSNLLLWKLKQIVVDEKIISNGSEKNDHLNSKGTIYFENLIVYFNKNLPLKIRKISIVRMKKNFQIQTDESIPQTSNKNCRNLILTQYLSIKITQLCWRRFCSGSEHLWN